ncbi:MAG: Long-chain-fatty-acid--CoA ligase FadD15 [Bacteroidetes bacterium ADurb.BinA104]|jgi:long-chain acyl-CoA synthetase|nr:MAG: Long-chain-fatty-acid--CoA ligase FadD15 [Bacteroidetes bacterium ADurb.BinA104]HQB97450.1 AMP-binding protein [Candidatus Cloacimonadota bacterium]
MMIEEKLIPYLVNSTKEHWELPAFTDYPGSSISYKDVAKRILWFHRVFRETGIKKGATIALAGKNCSNWALVWLGTVTYGATIVPILANFSPEDTQHIINHSDAELVFISRDKFDNIDGDQLKKVRMIFALDDLSVLEDRRDKAKSDIKGFSDHTDLHAISDKEFTIEDVCTNEDIAAIIYTSGTTGFSKGVMLPHRSLIANILVAHKNLLFSVGAKVFAFLPLAHAYACSFDLLYPFTRGNHINFIDRIPAPKILLAAMKDLKPEVVLTVPLLIEKIYKKQLQPTIESPKMKVLLKLPVIRKIILKKIHDKLMLAFGGNIRELITGGAPMNAEVEEFMKLIKFPFTIGYGMTECGPLISYANWHEHRYESSGKQVDYLTIKVNSKDPERIPGEIILKGEQVFKGYYKFEEATNEVLRDGWLYTGDIGTIDKDGFVYIRGRSKNVILGASGENIYPELVEQKLNNMPYVGESLVLERDRQLHAIVYPDFEALDADHIPEGKIPELMENNRNEVNKQLADFSRIIKIQIASEPFQKTPTQKIKRYLYI